MLYRFREAQEPELGFGTRADTAAHQELERWRGRAVVGDFTECSEDSGWCVLLSL
ncbi:hypothetical protein K438DRAFT_1837798, partial [Mycena galopus ATCC 62051]